MKGWIRRTWLGCVVALALGVPLAHADGGRITFSGAIVEPTCGLTLAVEGSASSSRGGCGIGTTDPALRTSFYRQTVVSLEDAMEAQDRLLAYFANYAGTNDTRLVTRTYE